MVSHATAELPILYSFRRCPYAMRARLALCVSEQVCELREVVLRDKPQGLIAASEKGTVPVLIANDVIIDESLNIMLWALRRNDPQAWMTAGALPLMLALIARCDGEFKAHLDRYKYPDRYAGAVRDEHRRDGARFLTELDELLARHAYLFGEQVSLADMAIAPFVRQFANTDETWFASQPWPGLQRWLQRFVDSSLFERVMRKYPQWQPGAPVTRFP